MVASSAILFLRSLSSSERICLISSSLNYDFLESSLICSFMRSYFSFASRRMFLAYCSAYELLHLKSWAIWLRFLLSSNKFLSFSEFIFWVSRLCLLYFSSIWVISSSCILLLILSSSNSLTLRIVLSRSSILLLRSCWTLVEIWLYFSWSPLLNCSSSLIFWQHWASFSSLNLTFFFRLAFSFSAASSCVLVCSYFDLSCSFQYLSISLILFLSFWSSDFATLSSLLTVCSKFISEFVLVVSSWLTVLMSDWFY